MAGDEGIFHPFFREKMLSAFFRISLSSSTADNSRCSLRISALAASISLGTILAAWVPFSMIWYRARHLPNKPWSDAQLPLNLPGTLATASEHFQGFQFELFWITPILPVFHAFTPVI